MLLIHYNNVIILMHYSIEKALEYQLGLPFQELSTNCSLSYLIVWILRVSPQEICNKMEDFPVKQFRLIEIVKAENADTVNLLHRFPNC